MQVDPRGLTTQAKVAHQQLQLLPAQDGTELITRLLPVTPDGLAPALRSVQQAMGRLQAAVDALT
uniref:hypothetical protein n=1 Tax=Actinomadura sp. CA-154981 TaxID=3240037 RepID=UPI003F499FA8